MKYLLSIVMLSTTIGCAQEDRVNINNTKAIREEVQIPEGNQSINSFFASEEYDGGKEEEQCIEDNLASFEGLLTCYERSTKIIKENIKKKLKSLNKPESILGAEHQKIKNKCTKETIKRLRNDGFNEKDDAPLANSSIADCIQHNLYQFGRKLK